MSLIASFLPSLIRSGNQALDKTEKRLSKLIKLHKFVSVVMWISVVLLIITSAICAYSIVKTVNTDYTIQMNQ